MATEVIGSVISIHEVREVRRPKVSSPTKNSTLKMLSILQVQLK